MSFYKGQWGLRWAGLALAALLVLWQFGISRDSDTSRALMRLDAVLYDWRFQALPPQRESILPIVIVDLDEATQQREGRWPWDRARVADLVRALRAHGARWIGFDVVFSEAVENPVARVLQAGRLQDDLAQALALHVDEFDGDAALAAVLDPSVVLGFFLHADGGSAGQLPPPLLSLSPEAAAASSLRSLPDYTASLPGFVQAGASSGFVVAIPDMDGVIRRVPLVLRHGDDVHVSLTLEMARQALNAPWIRLEQIRRDGREIVTGIRLGRALRIPLDATGDLLVPYKGLARSYTSISATGVLRGDAPPAQLAELQGALVLVGTSALGLSDLRSTPLQTGYPGVETHANVLDALLQAALGMDTLYVHPDWAPGAVLLLMLVLGVALSLLLPGRSPRLTLLVCIATLLALVALNAGLWHWAHQDLPLAASVLLVLSISLLNLTGGFFAANRQRHRVQSLFGEYVPAEHVARMVANPDLVSQAGEQRNMTVLFADVRNFTATSEHLTADQLKLLLNRYLGAVTEEIFACQGTIDKYVGDLVMAFWNAPLDDPAHAAHAVQAALAMQRRLASLREEFLAEGLPALHMGIGLNTGPMNVGDMGSAYRRAYTVLGDAVNLGSRVEGLTSHYGVAILLTDEVCRQAPDFVYRPVDRVRVKGRQEALEITQPLAATGHATADDHARSAEFALAIRLYRERKWGEAARVFEGCRQRWPQDARLCAIYLDRMAGIDPQQLPPNWDAVHSHASK